LGGDVPARSQNGASLGGALKEFGAIDPARLLEQLGGDSVGVEKLLLGFLREAPETVTRLRAALTARDAPGAEHAAHRLKGLLAWISARTAAARVAEIEQLARSGDLDSASGRLPELLRELDRVYAEARSATVGAGKR
jgi:HPt (histidine-containing phosphotransfer) domain-containing protein